MIALIQRVSRAHIEIAAREVGRIERGILALIGVRPGDDERGAARLLERVLTYRIFPDDAGRMNRNLIEVQGALMLVPQFTLAADTRKGTRAGFSTAAAPAKARQLFEYLVARAREHHPRVAAGEFAADMQVSLINDGPVTFWLEE
jgi:D-aminoacyl-tRNA deacylase